MNTNENGKWQSLLSSSAPAFAGEATPPYGFLTGTLARLREEKKQQEQLEKISFRALFASMVALVIMVGVTLSLHTQTSSDFEPGIRSLIQVENVPIS
jgi:hypothetical protein